MGKLLVMVFAAPCSHDKSCQNLHPDTRICTQFKSCTVTVFWLRSKLYRDPAPVPPTKILYRDSLPAPDKTCTATRVMLNKTCTRMAKTTPYPPCTVTDFWLKYQDRDRCLRRVTQPPHIAGPLVAMKSSCYLVKLYD